MDRKTDLRDMSAPEVASGKVAGDTMLANTAMYPTPSEKGPNTLVQDVTPGQPTSGAGGQAKFK